MYGGFEARRVTRSPCSGASIEPSSSSTGARNTGDSRSDVRASDLERLARHVGRDDAVELPFRRQSERDRARPRAHVGRHAVARPLEDALHEHLGLLTRDEDALVHLEREMPERGAPDGVRERGPAARAATPPSTRARTGPRRASRSRFNVGQNRGSSATAATMSRASRAASGTRAVASCAASASTRSAIRAGARRA